MAISLVNQPAAFSFSGNQIVFVLQSDDYIQTEGSTFSGYIEQTSTWPLGKEFIFQFGDERTTMTAALAPNGSGTLFSQGGSMELIYSQFLKNYVLNDHYFITLDGNKIRFTARKPGSFYNWKPATSLITSVAGTDRTERPGFKFLFEVFLENIEGTAFDKIFSEKLNCDNPLTGKLTIDIHDVLDSALQPDLPNPEYTMPIRCKNSKRRFYCRFAEVWGDPSTVKQVYESAVYHVATGGFSHLGHLDRTAITTLMPRLDEPKYDRFLKHHSGPFRSAQDQPEYLYFINMRAERVVYFKTRVRYSDGSYAEQIAITLSVGQYEKILFTSGFKQLLLDELQHAKTPVSYTCQLVSVTEAELSEEITYQLETEYKEWPRSFLYQSSLGAFDSFLVYGKQRRDQTLEQQQSERPKLIGYKITDGTRQSYALNMQRNFNVNTGWLNQQQFDLLTDFFLAEEKFLYNSGKMIPFSVTSKKVADAKDGNSLQSQEFTCSLNFTDDKYTPDDMQGIPIIPTPTSGLVYFGTALTLPIDEFDILALPESQNSDIRNFTLNTGVGKVFVLAYPSFLELHEVYNATAEEDVTIEYKRRFTVALNGLTYKVDAMAMSINYTTNQEHIVQLVNE